MQRKKLTEYYWSKDFYTFPIDLAGGNKKPMIRGFTKRETFTKESHDEWWKGNLNTGVAMPTGEISGFWVLDIDIKNGKDGLKEIQKIIPNFNISTVDTLVAKSPTGGYHLYYKIPEGMVIKNDTNLLTNVDVRSNGGCIVVAPSKRIIDGVEKHYEWLTTGEFSHDLILDAPQDIIDIATGKYKVSKSKPTKKNKTKPKATTTQQSQLGLPFYSNVTLDGVGEGERDQYIFTKACEMFNKTIPEQKALENIMIAAMNCTPPFDIDTALEKVERIYSTYTLPANASQTQSDLDEKVESFNKQFCVLSISGKTLIMDDESYHQGGAVNGCLYTFEDFKKLHCNKKVEVVEIKGNSKTKKKFKIAEEWLESESRRTFYKTGFYPANDNSSDEYNFWKGFPLQPVEGDSSKFWWHVEHIICGGDTESYIYVRKWLAHMIQKPESLPRIAIVISSKQGIGKGMFTGVLSELLYANNFVEIADMDKLLGQFNNLLMNKLLVVANEATWGGNRKDSGKLKALITDSNMTIEQKGIDTFQWKNYGRYIFCSNNSWVVSTDSDDRRFVFLDPSTEKKGDTKYFDDLAAFTRDPSSLESVMYDLENEDISSWSPDVRPNLSATKALENKYNSMSHIERFIYEWIKDRKVYELDKNRKGQSGYEITHDLFYEEYKKWCEDNNVYDSHTTSQIFAMTVYIKLIPTVGKSSRRSGGTVRCLPEWTDIYKYYCTNVIDCDPEWDIQEQGEEEKMSEALQQNYGRKRRSRGHGVITGKMTGERWLDDLKKLRGV